MKLLEVNEKIEKMLDEIEELKNSREVLISNIKKSNQENNQLINNFLDSIANFNFEPNLYNIKYFLFSDKFIVPILILIKLIFMQNL